jgi:hypothetical protein
MALHPPLWSNGQRSWLQIRRPGFDSRHYQKKSSGSGTGSTQPREYNWVATWYKSSGSCLENRQYGRRDPSSWPRGTLYPPKLAITSPTNGGRSVGIVRSLTQAREFVMALQPYVESWQLYSVSWNYTQSVGLHRLGNSLSQQGPPTHRTTHTQNTYRHRSLQWDSNAWPNVWVRKRVHALDIETTVIGSLYILPHHLPKLHNEFWLNLVLIGPFQM